MPLPRGLMPYHWPQENLEPGRSALGAKVGLWESKCLCVCVCVYLFNGCGIPDWGKGRQGVNPGCQRSIYSVTDYIQTFRKRKRLIGAFT